MTNEQMGYGIAVLLALNETTLNLEGLAITITGDQQISAISLAEKRRREGEKKVNSEKR